MLHKHYTVISEEYAKVTAVHHPLVRVQGFSTIHSGEVVIFEGGAIGQVLSFDEQGIDVISFDAQPIPLASKVYRSGQTLSIPVSDLLLGSCIDPLGNSLSGTVSRASSMQLPVDVPPLPLIDRHRINEPLSTNVAIVDVLLPIGKGQRQLIAGDRKTGKTSFAMAAAFAQAALGTIVVYALIGKKKAEVKRIANQFAESKFAKKFVVVATTPQDSVSAINTAPFTAMTIAEHFRDQGSDVLVILDDLTTHAKFYRELSLLAGKFPGRDSYPGDIFFTHARLLERAGCFTSTQAKDGSASITCLPLAETSSEDLTDYITSNLISITDGHLLFSSHLFASGHRPAIDSTLSVTRVGKQTQLPLDRDITLTVTRFISQYEKAKSLTHFGSELSAESQSVIAKGSMLSNLLTLQYTNHHGAAATKLLIACIWNGLATEATKAELKHMHQTLSETLATPKQQPLLTQLANCTSFSALLKLLTAQKTTILQLCGHDNT